MSEIVRAAEAIAAKIKNGMPAMGWAVDIIIRKIKELDAKENGR